MTSSDPQTSTNQPEILVERRDGIALILLNRPQERNPLGLHFSDLMLSILDELEKDDAISAIVLTGNGPGFCAGADLGKIVHPDGIDMEVQFRLVRGYNKVVQRIRQLDLPVIAAVNGPAVGGGAALALACDIAIAAEEARYYFAFGRVGACSADMGCAYMLPRLVGSMRAKHMMLTGATLNAQQAKAQGLVVDVVPRAQLIPAALEIAQQIKIATPRRAGAATKMAIMRGEDADFESCLSYEAYLQSYLFQTEDHKQRLSVLLAALKK